jgi:glycyl-tRNA synthetase beta chain
LVTEKTAEVAPLIAARDYQSVLTALAALRDPVDGFFDNVMVMADDPILRSNRLALLTELRALFLHVADVAMLAPDNIGSELCRC